MLTENVNRLEFPLDFNGKFKNLKKHKKIENLFFKKLDLLLIPERYHMLKAIIVCLGKNIFI
jgi:hypothetical protein